jgi:Neprosin
MTATVWHAAPAFGGISAAEAAGVRFTKAGLVQVFGEVAGSEITDPTTQMGNGTFGSKPGSAVFSAFTLLGSSTKPNLYVYDTAATWYDYGQPSKVDFHFGGPGA